MIGVLIVKTDFFQNKVFFDIAKILYFDNCIYYDILIFATLFYVGADVMNKTEAFLSSCVELDEKKYVVGKIIFSRQS